MEGTKAVVIDLETTDLPVEMVMDKRGKMIKRNLDYKTEYMNFPYIVSIAWKVNNEETREFIIFQEGREVPQESTNIHGITTAMANDVSGTITLPQALVLFLAECHGNDVIVGHNMYFDTSVMKAEVLRLIESGVLNIESFKMIEEVLCKFKRIDTMRSTIKMMGGKWGKLTEVYEKIFNENFEAHSAKNDVDATTRIYNHLVKNSMVPTVEELQNRKEEKQNGVK